MSKFVEKIVAKQNDAMNSPALTIAFLGDSVTQGCFEVYCTSETSIQTVFDKNCAYHNYLAKIFSVICPSVPINIINAGISGDNAPHGFERIEKDVISHAPDLVVVCFGLNDCSGKAEGLNKYITALSNIFDRLKKAECEIIFMTPNTMCTEASYRISETLIKDIAQETALLQNEGVLDMYIDAAKKLCDEKQITVCDCYAKWKKLEKSGISTTNLLSNYINHPSREMNWMFAYSLVETIFNM